MNLSGEKRLDEIYFKLVLLEDGLELLSDIFQSVLEAIWKRFFGFSR